MKKIILLVITLLLFTACIANNATPEDNSTLSEDAEVDEIIETVDYFYFESQRNLWGADPGLGINVLHELGYTGKGGVIAYCDGKLNYKKHEQFAEADIVYEDFPSGNREEWHGFGVLSLILGKNIGTAPDVKCYYFGYEPDSIDQKHIADVIREVIRVNDSLPEDEKIRMIGFSNNIYNIGPDHINNDEAIKATQEARDAGIMVFYCGENGALYYKDGTNRNDPENCYLIPGWENLDGFSSELSCVPAATRTVAYPGNKYRYDDETSPGLSWTQPFTIGLYGIAISIDSSLTEEDIRSLNVSTAFVNSRGMRIINPCEFIAAVLERVGRDNEANELREAYLASLDDYDYQKYEDLRCKDESLKPSTVTEYKTIDENNQETTIKFSIEPYDYKAINTGEVSYSFDGSSLDTGLVNVNGLSYSINENGDYDFVFSCTTNISMDVACVNTPNGDIVRMFFSKTEPLRETTYKITINKNDMYAINDTEYHTLLITVLTSDANRAFILFDVNQFELY